ncbi:MAG: DUF5018 domain-containing protein [Candidatus Staskawiczbacteria bacterium]|nr:DUF5018 domain-containing protein [Candidatus Staskawiczbacteria bacterium]
MDFSAISQIRNKKFWWMDVIFYFMISLLIATIFCYVIFLVKNNFTREDIKKEMEALQTVGTSQQKARESEVINYQKKVSDFANLLKSQGFASNVFAFVRSQTMPNTWFKQFSFDGKGSSVQLAVETDDLDSYSRQIAVLEKNKYIKDLGSLSAAAGEGGKVGFSLNLILDKSVFSYLASLPPILETTTPPDQSGTSQPGDKFITSFHLLSSPEVVGAIDESKYTVTLNVPYGTDVKNLVPVAVVSGGAVLQPDSNVPQDFTDPVTYKVTAQDGSIQTYEAKVIVAGPPALQPKPIVPIATSSGEPKQSGLIAVIIILLVVLIVAVGAFLFFKKRSKKQKTDINQIT